MYRRLGLNGNKVIYKSISEGREGTRETLAEMEKLIRAGAKDPFVIESTRNIIRDVPEKDYKQEVEKVFNFVQKNVRYTKDVVGVETISTPQKMLRDIKERGTAWGDCDDKTILVGSMLESIGHPIRMIVTSQSPSREYQHVYLEVFLSGMWIPLDATKKDAMMGWEHDHCTAKERYIMNELRGNDNLSFWPIGLAAAGLLILFLVRRK